MRIHRLIYGTIVLAATLAGGVAASEPAATDRTDPAGHYLAIQTALAGDSLDHVAEHAAALGEHAAGLRDSGEELPGLETCTEAARALATAADLDQARLAFGDLSEALVRNDGLMPDDGMKIAFCPMADRHWLQADAEIANPYYGAKMLRCGRFVEREESPSR